MKPNVGIWRHVRCGSKGNRGGSTASSFARSRQIDLVLPFFCIDLTFGVRGWTRSRGRNSWGTLTKCYRPLIFLAGDGGMGIIFCLTQSARRTQSEGARSVCVLLRRSAMQGRTGFFEGALLPRLLLLVLVVGSVLLAACATKATIRIANSTQQTPQMSLFITSLRKSLVLLFV